MVCLRCCKKSGILFSVDIFFLLSSRGCPLPSRHLLLALTSCNISAGPRKQRQRKQNQCQSEFDDLLILSFIFSQNQKIYQTFLSHFHNLPWIHYTSLAKQSLKFRPYFQVFGANRIWQILQARDVATTNMIAVTPQQTPLIPSCRPHHEASGSINTLTGFSFSDEMHHCPMKFNSLWCNTLESHILYRANVVSVPKLSSENFLGGWHFSWMYNLMEITTLRFCMLWCYWGCEKEDVEILAFGFWLSSWLITNKLLSKVSLQRALGLCLSFSLSFNCNIIWRFHTMAEVKRRDKKVELHSSCQVSCECERNEALHGVQHARCLRVWLVPPT